MKKTLILLLCATFFMSCKTDSKTTEETTETILKGDFVFYDDAAILQTKNEIYGIVINAKMQELNTKVKVLKKENTDMVPVEIKGIIKPKPEGVEGWPLQIEITDIITVSQPSSQNENTIKI